MLKLRIPNAVRRTYVVGVARTGAADRLDGAGDRRRPAGRRSRRAVTALTDAVRNAVRPRPGRVLPRRGRGRAGAAAAVRRDAAARWPPPTCPWWAGSTGPGSAPEPVPARTNVAATTCDKADFVRGGRPAGRDPHLPGPPGRGCRERFGITETYGAFRQRAAGPAPSCARSRTRWPRARSGPRRHGQQRGGAAQRLPRLGVRPVAAGQRDPTGRRRSASGWGSPAWAATSRR